MEKHSATQTNGLKILEQGLIASQRDILKLNIINWKGLNGYWSNMADALDTISSFFVGQAHYTIIETSLRDAPNRDDFPGWSHVGNHEYYGRLYWNWFHYNHKGELHFSDSPDFYGTLRWDDNKTSCFWGDVGQVSVSAMAHTQKNMDIGDIWISILGENRQVVIEPTVSFIDIWSRHFECKPVKISYTQPSQLPLF